ncbi:hypothetical protein Tco_0369872 [Tanacetum coccineum]
MRDANPIRTLGDYSKPSHEGYRNTILLPVGNNVLHDRNAKDSWELLEDLALYDNESWNDPRDFAKPVKEISLPQDVPMNKIATSCEICSSPHDTQYCMENPEQTFVEYASSRTDKAGDKCQSNLEGLVSNFMASQNARLSKFEADFKQQQSEMTNKIDTVLKAINDRITEVVCTKGDDGDVMFIEIVKKNDDSRKEEPKAGGLEVIFDEKKLGSS